jgi:hypothetical protein
MEIEVEVWQAMAHQGQQPPIAPPAAPAAPNELQGVSDLARTAWVVHHPILRILALAPLRATSGLAVVVWRAIMYS